MNCLECKELLVVYIEGLLPESQKKAVESHLDTCPPCRTELTHLTVLRDRLLANGETLIQSDLEQKVLNQILRRQSLKLKKVSKLNNQIQLWRKIMKSNIAKLATAAAIIVIAALSITLFEKSVTPAYGIEQTIEANHTIRYLHIRGFAPSQEEPMQSWCEFGGNGQVKNVRVDLPEWAGGGDGAKVVVWQENKAQVWVKKKNTLATIRDKTVAAQFLSLAEQFDPRLAVERLNEKETQGKAKIEIDEPSEKAEPIVVTATSLQESDSPFQRAVLFVDQATKLVTAVEFYKLKDGEYQQVITLEFYDYNQPIDIKMFTLNDEVPADVMRIDQTTQQVGLVQGEFSNEEIVVEVVRQFLEALIAEDYAKASMLYQGIPEEFLRKQLGKQKFVRIISIGKPEPSGRNNILCVPCKYEIEVDGTKSVVQSHPYVRPVFGQVGRWTIDGGI